MTIRQTCESCPEQYDMYQATELVGYLRLRHGRFTVRCPDGQIVYEASVGDEWTGQFPDEQTRTFHIRNAKAAIGQWLKKRRTKS